MDDSKRRGAKLPATVTFGLFVAGLLLSVLALCASPWLALLVMAAAIAVCAWRGQPFWAIATVASLGGLWCLILLSIGIAGPGMRVLRAQAAASADAGQHGDDAGPAHSGQPATAADGGSTKAQLAKDHAVIADLGRNTRSEMAKLLEHNFLSKGQDVVVRANGKDATTLWMKWAFCHRGTLTVLVQSPGIDSRTLGEDLYSAGFRKVFCDDGFGGGATYTWTSPDAGAM